MTAGYVGYNPQDPEQAALLAAIAKGESGGRYNVGWGGTDLSGYATDEYGFPKWAGKPGPEGNSRAAGAYQFQPGTWAIVAKKFGLDFRKPADQDAGAWYNAQRVYNAKTGGSLDADLDAGLFTKVQQAFTSEWTSAPGNANIPKGLAAEIAAGVGKEVKPGASGGSMPSGSDWVTSPIDSAAIVASNFFVRGGMILVGALILLVALWAILAHNDVVPGAKAIV